MTITIYPAFETVTPMAANGLAGVNTRVFAGALGRSGPPYEVPSCFVQGE